MIQLYNTLTRKKEEFIPIEDGKVKMYVCGPTVYNYIHIGNARSAVAFDTIRKYLEYRGYEVNYVSNFTDVDDKIIRAAKEMNITPLEVANQFIEAFNEDTTALNITPATKNPRVMDHIPDIIEFISELIDKDYAYVSKGDVYFKTTKFNEYGQLSHQNVADLEVGASQRLGDERDRKEDPLDFALWKSAKEDEIFWEAPWGKGRPGWHIECSVMTTKHLGDTIDIHGGGHDLIFPHHENEIAQSEARSGKIFANYWLHNGFVTVGEDDEKMSKSLGNFVTVHDLIQEIDPQVVRFFLSTTQYRRPIQFSNTTMKEAEVNLQRLKTTYQNLNFRTKDAKKSLSSDGIKTTEIQQFVDQFIIEMDDDINTANGITVIYEFIKWLNIYLEEADVSLDVLLKAKTTLEQLSSIFGVTYEEDKLLDHEIEALIEERQAARLAKDFATSDAIRDTLKEKGIILEDTAQGMRWRRDE